MNGASPSDVYQVDPVRSSMSRTITRCSRWELRSTTVPSGAMNAVNPVGATCTTQRPVSIARRRLDATCWVCTIVPV